MSSKYNFATRAIHSGYNPDKNLGSISVPIYQTSIFKLNDFDKPRHGFDYSRNDNPTRAVLESCIADLEGAKYGLAFSSGMAAINNCIYLLTSGSHVIVSQHLYGGTYRYFAKVATKYNIEVDFVDITNPDNLERHIKENTRMIWVETPSNPLMYVTDLEKVVSCAQNYKIVTVADNTFMTPYFQNPLSWGIDIVVHSCTKYLGGHSDLLAGALLTSNDEIYQVMKFHQSAVGAVPGPLDCFLLLRGIKTLPLRMEAHEKNAKTIADYLLEHPKVKTLYYPGLADHPQYIVAAKQMKGSGGIVSFELNGDEEAVNKFIKGLNLFSLTGSLGGVESLVSVPYHMSHAAFPKEIRESLGITSNLMRLSVGIEDINDIIQDLDKGFNAI
ncbi:MAG: PLP-dependent aspartate aminotransferase family protein [Armatimonadota bacterium]